MRTTVWTLSSFLKNEPAPAAQYATPIVDELTETLLSFSTGQLLSADKRMALILHDILVSLTLYLHDFNPGHFEQLMKHEGLIKVLIELAEGSP